MTRLGSFARAVLFGTALTVASSCAALAEDSSDPIKIITNNWTSQLVLANVVGQILQAQGYNIEYKSSDTQLQYTGPDW